MLKMSSNKIEKFALELRLDKKRRQPASFIHDCGDRRGDLQGQFGPGPIVRILKRLPRILSNMAEAARDTGRQSLE